MNPLWFVPAATFSLGAWQLSRLDWKIKLIEKASRRQLLAPETEIPELGIDGVDVENEFKRIKLDGEFLYDQEVFVGPRPRNDGATERDGTFRNTGFIVVTPFKSTSGETLLVNRGWLPSDWKSESISLFKNQIVAMEGFLRRGEPGSYFISSSIPSKGKWYTINTDLMSTHLKSSKVMIEMTKGIGLNFTQMPNVTKSLKAEGSH